MRRIRGRGWGLQPAFASPAGWPLITPALFSRPLPPPSPGEEGENPFGVLRAGGSPLPVREGGGDGRGARGEGLRKPDKTSPRSPSPPRKTRRSGPPRITQPRKAAARNS